MAQSNAPDLIAWCSFNEDGIASGEQERLEFLVLAELVHVAFGDQLASVRLPYLVVKATNLATNGLG